MAKDEQPKKDRTSSPGYIIGFAVVVCLVCAILVSGAAVALKERQEINRVLDQKTKVLMVAGKIEKSHTLSPDEIQALYDKLVTPRVVILESGEFSEEDAESYDIAKELKDPAKSDARKLEDGQMVRVPKSAVLYKIGEGGPEAEAEMYVLPVYGKGLWSTMYGFVAIDADGNTMRGLTFYDHGETAGLGGEIDNPIWQEKWPGRKVYNDAGEVTVHVVKGGAGPVESAPYEVDGLSGATITGKGVTYMIQLWLGPQGYGPFIQKVKKPVGGAS